MSTTILLFRVFEFKSTTGLTCRPALRCCMGIFNVFFTLPSGIPSIRSRMPACVQNDSWHADQPSFFP